MMSPENSISHVRK